MSRLHQALISTNRKLWYVNHRWLDSNYIANAALRLARFINTPNIALAFPNDDHLALAMIAADSRCKRVLLIPSSWDQTTVETYLKRANIGTVLTTRDDLIGPNIIHLSPNSMYSTEATHKQPSKDIYANTHWIIPTSGTTGNPKLVEHALSSLTRTVKEDKSKGRDFTWGLLYELGRFAGLQVFLQALLGGSKLIFISRDTDLNHMVKTLADGECNALSATPTLWRRLMMTQSINLLPLRLITLGGEISDQGVLNALASRFPKAKIVHIYASTEAGVGFSVTDGITGFPCDYLKNSPNGIELKISQENILWLRPPAAKQRFIGEEHALVNDECWIDSGDRVECRQDRYHFLGRANGTINVGGNKVFPEEIENVIKEVEGVQLVLVKAKSNHFTGSLVEAIIKPASNIDQQGLKRSIIRHCKTKLEPFKIPAIISWAENIKTNEAGKIIRNE